MRKLRMLLAALAVAFTALLVLPVTAFADEDAPLVVSDTGTHFIISPIYWTVVVGLLLPVVVAALTKNRASSRTRAVLAILGDAIAAIAIRATTVDGSGLIDQALIIDFAFLFVPTVASYVGFWQPVAQVNEKLAPNFGIGPSGPA